MTVPALTAKEALARAAAYNDALPRGHGARTMALRLMEAVRQTADVGGTEVARVLPWNHHLDHSWERGERDACQEELAAWLAGLGYVAQLDRLPAHDIADHNPDTDCLRVHLSWDEAAPPP